MRLLAGPHLYINVQHERIATAIFAWSCGSMYPGEGRGPAPPASAAAAAVAGAAPPCELPLRRAKQAPSCCVRGSASVRHLPRPQRKILSRDTAARTYLQPRGVCSAQHFVDGAVLLARRCALRVYRRARGASRALTRSAARRGAEHTLGRCCAPRAAEAVAEGGKHAHCQIRLRSGWLSTPAGGAGRTPVSL